MSGVVVNARATESIELKKVTKVVRGTDLETGDIKHGIVG